MGKKLLFVAMLAGICVCQLSCGSRKGMPPDGEAAKEVSGEEESYGGESSEEEPSEKNMAEEDAGEDDAAKGDAGASDASEGDARASDAGKGDADEEDAGKSDAAKGDAGEGSADGRRGSGDGDGETWHEEPVSYSYDLFTRTTDTVNLRVGPSTDTDVLAVLEKGAELKVADIDADNWARVRTRSGYEGYVLADYIEEPMDEAAWLAFLEERKKDKTICIDAGHQMRGNNDQEPIGPGSSQTKAKVSGGTSGVSTGKPEYELTLEIALKLQAELEDRGYAVIMCRTENDVDISNAERAEVANDAGVDAFLRIHADGSESSSAKGAHTICQTASNPFNAELHGESLALSQCVISEYIAATGASQAKADDGVDERDDLSGINWCQVPATLIEMGFMTNPEEDALMSSEEYQQKMVSGIANGVDKYFGS